MKLLHTVYPDTNIIGLMDGPREVEVGTDLIVNDEIFCAGTTLYTDRLGHMFCRPAFRARYGTKRGTHKAGDPVFRVAYNMHSGGGICIED
jgi:hypothetical protein